MVVVSVDEADVDGATVGLLVIVDSVVLNIVDEVDGLVVEFDVVSVVVITVDEVVLVPLLVLEGVMPVDKVVVEEPEVGDVLVNELEVGDAVLEVDAVELETLSGRY